MDALKKLNENFLSCCICKEIFEDPCTIGCYHTFCRPCLVTYTKTRRDAITANSILCPICRQMTKVPRPEEPVDQWCNQFKPSFLIQGLLDTFSSQNGASEGSYNDCCFTCNQIGDRTRASRACADCDVMLCDRCSKIHTSTPSSADHEVSPLSGDSRPQRKRKVMCTEHACAVEFCCRDCNKAVCSKCCVLCHRTCDSVVTIVSIIPEMKEVIEKNYGQLYSNLHQFKSNLEDKRTQVQQNNKRRVSLRSEIRKLSQEAVNSIKHKEKKLLDELEALADKTSGQLRGQIQAVEADVETYQQYTEFVSHVLQSTSPMDLYDMFQACQSGEITAAAPRLQSTRENVPHISLQKDLDQSQMDKSFHLGHFICDHVFSLNPNNKSEIRLSSERTVAAPSISDIVVVEVYGIEVIAVIDTANNQIKSLFQAAGRLYIKPLKLENSGPLNVCKFGTDSVLVSFASKRVFQMIVFTPAPARGGFITTRKKYSCLTSLTDTSLAAGCSSPPSIDVLDLSGRVLKTVISPSRVRELVQDHWYMRSTHKGNIVIVDGLLATVYCLTQQGQVLYKRKLPS